LDLSRFAWHELVVLFRFPTVKTWLAKRLGDLPVCEQLAPSIVVDRIRSPPFLPIAIAPAAKIVC
jgi:hypothetical protein